MAKRSGQKKTTRRPKATRPRRRTVSTPRAKALTPQRATRRREPVTGAARRGSRRLVPAANRIHRTRVWRPPISRGRSPPHARGPEAHDPSPASCSPARGEEVLEQPAPTVWLDRLAEYKQRKAVVAIPRAAPCRAGGARRRQLDAARPFGGHERANRRQRIGRRPRRRARDRTRRRNPLRGVRVRRRVPIGRWRRLVAVAHGRLRHRPDEFRGGSLTCGAIAIDPGDPEPGLRGNRRRRDARNLSQPDRERSACAPRHRAHSDGRRRRHLGD